MPEVKTYNIEFHQLQLANAAKYIAALEEKLRAAGYVNTIQDCWELPNDAGEDAVKICLLPADLS